jgi:hypothetical protein
MSSSTLIDDTRVALQPLEWLWLSPLTDPAGHPGAHDPRSEYVEVFWTPVLGCSSVMLARRLADALDAYPDGLHMEMAVLASSLGFGHGPTGLLLKSLSRLVGFGLAAFDVERCDYQLRLGWPSLSRTHLARLPAYLRDAHRGFV